MQITIDIDPDDISYGLPGHGEHCALARALKREIDKIPDFAGSHVDVGYRGIAVEGRLFATHTEASRRFITRFDNGERVTPTRLRLRFS